jgi:hypothetical protein
MLTRLLASAILVAGLSQFALAQNSSTQNSTQPAQNGQPSANQSADQNNQNVPHELQKKLSDAGFTNVKVVPSSFFVTAKNKEGQDVMIRISPNSMTMVTEVPADNTATTGKGNNSTNSNNGSSTKGNNSSNGR